VEVARDLLGKLFWVREKGTPDLWSVVRIIETEAYRSGDPASHSCRGETPRSSVMFGPPGRAYVYFIYGMYEMLNFVTEPEGEPGAVLIRAGEPVRGEERMRRRRLRASATPGTRSASALTLSLANGPGKLTQALGIGMKDNRQSLQGPRFLVTDDLWRPDQISVSPRVGIREGLESNGEGGIRPWRFFVTGHPCVSKAPQNREAKPLSKGRSGLGGGSRI
jgi:DNA-3-methyladenine glycosylase